MKSKISTNDGRSITVKVGTEEYVYSIDDKKIDVSEMILYVSKLFENLEIDDKVYQDYVNNNEVEDTLKEMFNFVYAVLESYNNAIDEVDEELLDFV